MNVLAIDTSTHLMAVALVTNGQVVGKLTTNLPKNHSVRLMPAISKLMAEVEMSPKQLHKIVVGKGPGSYTGVRIGLTTAKSMAWALNIPVVGISSIQALAYQGRFFNSYICPFYDARRGNVYTGMYQWKHDKLVTVYQEENISMESWLDKLQLAGGEILFLSPDIELHKTMIIEKLPNTAIIPELIYHVLDPAHLAMAGMDEEADPTHMLTPNYLRLAEAEANWIKSQKETK
ncbi:MAG TPA: tRNA (adenosine(37)-N6)-threonylcarbamoyltransferase complex dimerization subunit type 1 TsaB [Virgibacillus sp.]|nr:tRNA (adenosine(37)-N6)-threonylcarbamoyltransferase complex dimerization subunit type 1 TsaB [Virgibacillus sp.]